MSIVIGLGDLRVAHDLYRTAVLREVERMRREGVYVCMGNVMSRMPDYNQEILCGTLWALAREGKLS